MKQLRWGDTLLGQPVTPETWGHEGLVEFSGKWGSAVDIVRDCEPTWDTSDFSQYPELRRQWLREHTRPVWPPLNFAGRTDAELWAEIVGAGWLQIGIWRIRLNEDGTIWRGIKTGSTGIRLLSADESAALLTDGANTLLLAASLEAGR